jgi:hypothetical protein
MRQHRFPIVALVAGLAVACCLPLLLLADGGIGPQRAVRGAHAKAASAVVGVPVPLDDASYTQLKDRSAITLRDWVLDDGTQVAERQPSEFTVAATGYAPLSYQWKKDNQDIAGATDATYVIPTVEPDDAADYTVEATNTCGSVLSDPVTLTVTAGDCPGDLNGDNFRNVTNFSLFALAYGSQIGDPNYNPAADMNSNGFVNSTDFTQFAAVYGVPCP